VRDRSRCLEAAFSYTICETRRGRRRAAREEENAEAGDVVSRRWMVRSKSRG
jgi:hypothetical protein